VNRRLDSSLILKGLGFEYYSYTEERVSPPLTNVSFRDLIPEFNGLPICNSLLYKHQLEAYNHLSSGKNIILKSGTGSGKTEAWLLYTFKHRITTMVIYPTLALANDQIRRINEYSRILNYKAMAIDSMRRTELVKIHGRSKLRSTLSIQNILITNPAFLMHEIKKIATYSKGILLDGFISRMELLVIDDIDFYGPREIALLLSLIKILILISERKFQIATLTATIENPEELARFLNSINNRETIIVSGLPFRVENRVYVVLGRNLKALWEKLKLERSRLIREGVGEDILKALDNYSIFKEQYYKVIEVAQALNINIGSLEVDPLEIIQQYINDSGVTLIFTKSIARAEEIARRLRNNLPDSLKDCIAAHHHLLLRDLRRRIEDEARVGKIKILISPRTLSQGIDIGDIVRIVHVGLPESLREFYQREGRKGRRGSIEFSETVILPGSRWDRDILSRGVESLRSWLQLPLEKVIINPKNKYIMLFEALLKYISPKFKHKLSLEEYKFLEDMNIIHNGELTVKGRETWINLNFYEFAPPYGINRAMISDNGEHYLEEISHCDLVEKFQPGCIDYTSDGIITEHRIGGRTGRTVTAVVEEKISEKTLWKRDQLAQALEEYEEAKIKWGEEPSITRDYAHGRIHSEVICVVYPPRKGFGRYIKIPNRVIWRVISSKPRIKRINDKTLTFRDYKTILVPTATYGKYSDFTYGSLYELEPDENLTLLRIGLALVMVVLRKKLRIPFETIMYDLGKIGEKKLMSLHEPESAGLIESINWLNIRRIIEEYRPEDLDEVLIKLFDEYAYSDLITQGFNWEQIKRAALKAIDYILVKERIPIKFKDLELTIPKPSKALRKASIDINYIPLIEDANTGLISIGLFNGEDEVSIVIDRDFSHLEDTYQLDIEVSKIVNEDYTVLVYDWNSILKALLNSGLKTLNLILKSLHLEGKIIDVKKNIIETLNIQPAPLEEVEKAIGINREVTIGDLRFEVENSIRKISETPPGEWKKYTKYLREKLKKHQLENCKSTYILYLVMEEYKRTLN